MATYEEILARRYPGTVWTCGGPYETLEWHDENTVPKPTQEELDALQTEVQLEIEWEIVRRIRNGLLYESDWTQVDDIPKDIKKKWKKYRQELREIPNFFDDPDFIIWPEKPE